jgi:glutamate--cysteine ligase catalytic subunit
MCNWLLPTVYKDKFTKSPYLDDFAALTNNDETQVETMPDHIYMDCMGFGMGCSCLQVTFQACNITEARKLYDELAPLCPIMVGVISLVKHF